MKSAVSAEHAVAQIESGQRVFLGSGATEPASLVAALTQRGPELRNVSVVHILTLGEAPYAAPELTESFRHTAFFIGPNVRAAVQEGRADFVPIFLSEVPALFKERLPIDWALVQLSPPDAHGFCTVGVSADVVISSIRSARHVVAEINPQMPRVLGDTLVHVDELDYIVEVDRPLPELPAHERGPETEQIGVHVASLIRDGDCLQAGVGAIPDAALTMLGERRDLGLHTEMISDGALTLFERGALTGKHKQVLPGKLAASFALGSQRLYDFLDDNPVVEFHGNEFINDPHVIAKNNNMVAINSALAVDLTGQVCADSFGSVPYSGIGGQVDFIRGAARSKGGRPIIALPSTAKNGTISRIDPTLPPGSGVVTSRGDVHFIVTEHGVADLYGRGIHERARQLIDIAEPLFRDDLERQARELHLIPKSSF